MVPAERIELSWVAPYDLESCVSTNFTTRARRHCTQSFSLKQTFGKLNPMRKQTHDFIKFASVPLVLLAILLALIGLFHLFDLPDYNEIIAWAKASTFKYGYWFIFIGALAEGILFFNWYLPGSVVVVLGGVFAPQMGLSTFKVVALIIFGFWLTSILNYAMGRYGWYRLLLRFGLKGAIEKTKARVEKHGLKIIFGTYFHPNIGALTATSAGILQLSFKKFLYYSTMALVAWNTLWGTVAYYIGPPLVEQVHYKNLVVVLLIWLVILFFQFIRSKGKVVIPDVGDQS